MQLFNQRKGHQWQPVPCVVRQDLEAACALQFLGKVIGCVGEVAHDGGEALLTKADENIILRDHVRGAFAKVKCEGGL